MAALNLLSLILIFYSLVKAQQPDGYLGCYDNDSLINGTETCINVSYTGDICKAECKLQHKRYAGTKNGKECICGDDFYQIKKRNSSLCNWNCTGNIAEMCGSSLETSLYDTWKCMTGICKNGATCLDIDADHFSCICSDGWTGTLCNERVYSTTSYSTDYLFSSTSSSLSTSKIASSTMPISTLVTTTDQLSIQSSSVDTKKTVFVSADATTTANNTHLLDNQHVSATNIRTNATVYISVSVTIIIVVVIGVIILLIIRRKRQHIKQDSSDIYNSSNGNTLMFSKEHNPIYNDHNKIKITTCNKETIENAMSEKNCSAFEEISHQYNTIDPPYHSETEIQTETPVDEDAYEHIKSTTNVVFDPTYSHTTDLQTEHTNDEMYSQVNKVANKPKLNSNTNQNNETYDTLKNNTAMGAPKPVVHSGETDDTYNTVSKTGKTTFRDDSNNASCLNEPDYDHIDSKDL